MTPRPQKRPRGRPPAGPRGAWTSEYPQLLVRLPPATLARLRAWVAIEKRPAAVLVAELIDTAVAQMPEGLRRRVQRAARQS